MYKLLGAVLIIFCGIAFGMTLTQRLQKKADATACMISAVRHIANEIEYKLTPITQIIEELSEMNGFTGLFFSSLRQKMQTDPEASLIFLWKKTVAEHMEKYFYPEDARVLLDVGDFLGRYDKIQQVHSLHCAADSLVQRAEELKQTAKTKGRIYKTCSFAAGLLLVLVLI